METKVIRIEIKFTRTTLAVLLGSVLLLSGLMIGGGSLAQNPDPETGHCTLPLEVRVVDAGETTTLATVGNVAPTISYQGRLTDPDGNPLSGDYDMTFQLRDAETDGDIVGSAITKTGVTVEDGLFDVKLDVDPDDFSGQELWLGVTVSGETLTPTQQILPAPYALSLRPGAIISDSSSYVELNRYHYSTMPIFQNKYGVYAKSEGTGIFSYNYGVYGSGSDYGVYGYSSDGTAIYGNGDVRQSRDGNGLVKAAAYVGCQNESPLILRSFNNVNSDPITITGGLGTGACTIDFNFDLRERYWNATIGTYGFSFCSRGLGIDDDQLTCYCYNDTGTPVDCPIMVLIY
jgi:hypothetical protein